MVCFRCTVVNTLYKGDIQDGDDDNNNNHNNNNNESWTTSSEVLVTKCFRAGNLFPFQSGFCSVWTLADQHTAQCMLQTCIIKGNVHINYNNRTTQLLSSVCFEFFPTCLRLYSYSFFLLFLL